MGPRQLTGEPEIRSCPVAGSLREFGTPYSRLTEPPALRCAPSLLSLSQQMGSGCQGIPREREGAGLEKTPPPKKLSFIFLTPTRDDPLPPPPPPREHWHVPEPRPPGSRATGLDQKLRPVPSSSPHPRLPSDWGEPGLGEEGLITDAAHLRPPPPPPAGIRGSPSSTPSALLRPPPASSSLWRPELPPGNQTQLINCLGMARICWRSLLP